MTDDKLPQPLEVELAQTDDAAESWMRAAMLAAYRAGQQAGYSMAREHMRQMIVALELPKE